MINFYSGTKTRPTPLFLRVGGSNLPQIERPRASSQTPPGHNANMLMRIALVVVADSRCGGAAVR